MEKQQFSAKQVAFIVLLTVLFTLLIFLLGGVSVYLLLHINSTSVGVASQVTPHMDTSISGVVSSTGSPDANVSTPTMPALPRAVTATIPEKIPDDVKLTDSEATQLAMMMATELGSENPLSVRQVFFTEGKINLVGEIDYLEYKGEFTMSGKPYVEAGKLKVDLDTMKVNDQPLPVILLPSIEESTNYFFSDLFRAYKIIDVKVDSGGITLKVLSR